MTTRISVFGLGYVGCVSAACFARQGFEVIGADIAESKVARINAGQSTILEEGIAELVAEQVQAGRLRATTDVAEAVHASDISLVCVGTPSRRNGSLNLAYVERVAQQIGAAVRSKQGPHTVVIRSTVLPGTIAELVAPALEAASGRTLGHDLFLCSNPEFLREGSSIRDFYAPPFTLIGAESPEAASAVAALYAGIDAPLHVVPIKVAEMVKYVCNCFHGLKVAFANEIGSICKALDVDSHEVMRLVCEDRKLNISPAYLKPGFAFGGSCLPKDLRAVTYKARELDVDVPLLSATLDSNRKQIERAYHLVMASGARRVGILGLSFKAGTDDLRESPMVSLIEMLLGKGVELMIYDRDVSASNLVGANREFVETEIPHIWQLMQPSVAAVLDATELVVIGNGSPEFRDVLSQPRAGQQVLDLVRITSERPQMLGYQGIGW